MITIGSLFSGIGGIDLGLERTGGFKTIWFSEVDNYASEVLRKHWPNVPNYGDIKSIPWRKIRKPDMLIGGFPCQDISIAGKGAGIKEGTRSGLWSEYAKAIRILRPKLVLIENVPMLANRGLNIVLSDLAKIGYDAEWNIISAASVGAPHKRERLFVIAYPNSSRCDNRGDNREERPILPTEEREIKESESERNGWKFGTDKNIEINSSDSDCRRCNWRSNEKSKQKENDAEIQGRSFSIISSNDGSKRIHRFFKEPIRQFPEFSWCKEVRRIEDLRNRSDIPQPLVCGNRDGLSQRLDNYTRIERTKTLGNAVVPQVAQTIGEMILKSIRGDEKHETI